jgi:hypothetical protein
MRHRKQPSTKFRSNQLFLREIGILLFHGVVVQTGESRRTVRNFKFDAPPALPQIHHESHDGFHNDRGTDDMIQNEEMVNLAETKGPGEPYTCLRLLTVSYLFFAIFRATLL